MTTNLKKEKQKRRWKKKQIKIMLSVVNRNTNVVLTTARWLLHLKFYRCSHFSIFSDVMKLYYCFCSVNASFKIPKAVSIQFPFVFPPYILSSEFLLHLQNPSLQNTTYIRQTQWPFVIYYFVFSEDCNFFWIWDNKCSDCSQISVYNVLLWFRYFPKKEQNL